MGDVNKADKSAKAKPDTGCDATTTSCPAEETPQAKCVVHFRPKDNWSGEYGFDWMRIGGPAEMPAEEVYKDVITGGHPRLTATQAYAALKSQYKTIPTKILAAPENLAEYFVPYLNLYPKGVVATPTPPFEAELKILIAVEVVAPDAIDIEYDDTLFDLDKKSLTDTAVGAKRESGDGTLKITCKAPFSTAKEIKVWSTSNGVKELAGRIIVCPNDPAHRKSKKFVLVKVKTKIRNVERIGDFSGIEKDSMINALHQALIHATFEDGPDLDLTADPNFKIITKADGSKTYGRLIYRKTSAADIQTDGGIYRNAPANGLFTYLAAKFFGIRGNEKYRTGKYFTVFCFDEVSNKAGVMGRAEGLGKHNVALFEQPRKASTFAHEAMHGFSLRHLDDAAADNPYEFDQATTDNIMSYAWRRHTTWYRQWNQMKKHV